ncbi:hypothetical protein XH9_03615 [Glutamicibacter mysorens]|nr:hypothetical protein [Glutamicibacter mysorens]UTM47911.1 hypothetical protein XH9_03615 [Glutamicibacter mysorens]
MGGRYGHGQAQLRIHRLEPTAQAIEAGALGGEQFQAPTGYFGIEDSGIERIPAPTAPVHPGDDLLRFIVFEVFPAVGRWIAVEDTQLLVPAVDSAAILQRGTQLAVHDPVGRVASCLGVLRYHRDLVHPAVAEVVFEVEFTFRRLERLAQGGGLLGFAQSDLQPALFLVPGDGLVGARSKMRVDAVEGLQVRVLPAHRALQGQSRLVEHDDVVHVHGAPDQRVGPDKFDSHGQHSLQ